MKKRPTPHPAATPDTTDRPEPGATPVTPPDVLRQACACCGAILPAPLSRLDAIPGQEHLRRAVTVALTGKHPITFLGSGGALADALAFGRIARHYGMTAYVSRPRVSAGTPATPTSPVAAHPRRSSRGSDGPRFRPHWRPSWSSKLPTPAPSSI